MPEPSVEPFWSPSGAAPQQAPNPREPEGPQSSPRQCPEVRTRSEAIRASSMAHHVEHHPVGVHHEEAPHAPALVSQRVNDPKPTPHGFGVHDVDVSNFY
jgi:hypothetical protein